MLITDIRKLRVLDVDTNTKHTVVSLDMENERVTMYSKTHAYTSNSFDNVEFYIP